MPSPARQLVDLISASLSTLEQSCATKGLEIPDLHAAFNPASEAFRDDPAAAEAANLITAAALQLAAIISPPQNSLYEIIGAPFTAAAARICIESNVTEILREGGPNGVHMNEIAAKSGQEPQKIARFLRTLATRHIYREVSPNVFANNRLSSMLDTLKPHQELVANPDKKHDNTHGLPALVSHHLDECFKSAAYGWEFLCEPKSDDSKRSPWNLGMSSNESTWEFYSRPDQEYRKKRFHVGMQGVQALQPLEDILALFDWKSLPTGSVVVDVGGGVGTVSLSLARDFPDLQIVLQDLPSVVEEAKKVWQVKLPDAVNNSRIKFEVQDFFSAQPEREVSVFFMKHILHDWPDANCVKILKALWDASSANTKLVLMEFLVPYACHDPSGEHSSIPGLVPPEAPAPLLANYGAVNGMTYNADMVMFYAFNAQERTSSHMRELLSSAGWELTAIQRPAVDKYFLALVQAVPIGK